jgi:hypothetical protein
MLRRMRRPYVLVAAGFTAFFAAALDFSLGCGSKEGSGFADPPPPSASNDGSVDPSNPVFPSNPADGPFTDFPQDPIVDGDAPANSAELFGGAPSGPTGGPCLMEPEVGSMLPRNWLRPRFRWIAPGSLAPSPVGGTAGNLFELKLHAENQTRDLVVYTKSLNWTMSQSMWTSLRIHSADVPITMTIRGGVLDGTVLRSVVTGSSGPLTIAPVEAPGSIVYWTTTAGGGGTNPILKGFRIGDESVTDVLKPAQMPNTNQGSVKCVGCHTSTPDGLYAAVSTRAVPDCKDADECRKTQIGLGSADGKGTAPAYVSASAQALLRRTDQTAPTFSKAHFSPGDRIGVSMLEQVKGAGFQIVWTDFEASSQTKGSAWNVFARTGDPNYAALANVSHDGSKIVYVSTPNIDTAGTIVTEGKIFTVPWNNRKGGTATELSGANVAGSKQFYPTYSPDDTLVAFDRSPAGLRSYNDEDGEIYVINAGGGTAQRLAANDPPACSGAKSPGVFNSWPKWSPEVGVAGTKKYYFLVFSSARNNGTKKYGARLYITPVVVDGANITSYSSLYLWNQPETEDNHSPAWDNFKIPDIVK